MKKIIIAICLIQLFSLSIVAQRIKEDFHTKAYISRMDYFSKHPLTTGQIVFLGNSITEAGQWDKYFPEQQPANRGINGDSTQGMLARISEITDAKPNKIFIMAGINDISLGRNNKEILGNYRKIIRSIKKQSPKTQIYIQSVLPINNDFNIYARLKGKESRIVSLNSKLKKLADTQKITFINLYPLYIDKDGKLQKEITADGLHLFPEAYSKWVEKISTFVTDNNKDTF